MAKSGPDPLLHRDPFFADKEAPIFWRDGYGFFIVCSGRMREQGWAFGRLKFNWRYTKWLMGNLKRIMDEVKASERSAE